jgi:hypothetical protein
MWNIMNWIAIKNSHNEKQCLVLAFVIIIFFVFLCVNV